MNLTQRLIVKQLNTKTVLESNNNNTKNNIVVKSNSTDTIESSNNSDCNSRYFKVYLNREV